ncbi:MAG TPA: hypothetical protein PKN48_06125 [Bacteroidales bacterium]|nr:hypothetical protein [Bacteroidales bacterium]
MNDELNENTGKISGKSNNVIDTSGKIAGSYTDDLSEDKLTLDVLDQKLGKTRKERISLATEEKGLKSLPLKFGDSDGDWQIIESDNLFEVLYLDHFQINLINPEIVKNNHALIKSFWVEKRNFWQSGSGQVRKSVEDKFGAKNLDSCITKVDYALEQLFTIQNINSYYQRLNEQRLKQGEEYFKDSIEDMLANGVADKSEIEMRLNRGEKYELTREETALILKRAIDKNGLLPYPKGEIKGKTLIEQLLSVESWMTPVRIEEAERIKIEQKSLEIQILPGKYAKNINEIGTILFDDPKEAKEIIKEDLLKQSIAQKDIVLAREIGNISKNAKNIDLAYTEIVYKLNKKLPYRFSDQKLTNDPAELCSFFFENNKTVVSGKEQIKKGFVEIWLKETNEAAYQKFIKIRDKAPNIDLAFLEFLYTFNSKLPYRFAGEFLVKTPKELCSEINKNTENWDHGKKELFNSSILVWLNLSGNSAIVEQWEKVKKQFKGIEDDGLEHFLHLLNKDIEYANIVPDMTEISFPKIQSGDIINREINFKNKTRGYAVCDLSLSNNIEGVTLNVSKLFFNAASNINDLNPILKIDTANLIRGQLYTTEIKFSSSAGQEMTIPVSFKIVFPKHAFIQEIVKSAFIFAIIGILIRLAYNLIGYSGWVNERVNYYLDIKDIDYFKALGLEKFTLIFILLLALTSIVIFFRKPLLKLIGKAESLLMNLLNSRK